MEELDKIRAKLRKHHFVAITGPDKHGTTRFCKNLRKSLEVDRQGEDKFNARMGAKWKVVMFGLNRDENPFDQLAREIGHPENEILIPPGDKVTPVYERRIRTMLRKDDHLGLIKVYEENDYLKKYNFLVIVDRFEELFANTEIGSDQQENFIKLLVNASFENQILYVAIGFKAPKTARWKFEFPELSEAVTRCEYPVFAMNERTLAEQILKFYKSESLRTQRMEVGLMVKVLPHKMKLSALEELVGELYIDPDPLGKMKEVVTAKYIAKTNDGFEEPPKLVSRRKAGRIAKSITPTLSNAGVPARRAVPIASVPSNVRPLVEAAEAAYKGLNMIQKRAAEKFFVELGRPLSGFAGQAPIPVKMEDLITRAGKFSDILMQLAGIFSNKGIIIKEPDGVITVDSYVKPKDNALFPNWERTANWTNMTAEGEGGDSQQPGSQQKSASMSRSVGSVEVPATFKALVNNAESGYQSLNMIQKRAAQKFFAALAEPLGGNAKQAPVAIKMQDLADNVGKFTGLLFELAGIFSAKGVIIPEPKGAITPETLVKPKDNALFGHWERASGWTSISPADIEAPAALKQEATEPAEQAEATPNIYSSPASFEDFQTQEPEDSFHTAHYDEPEESQSQDRGIGLDMPVTLNTPPVYDSSAGDADAFELARRGEESFLALTMLQKRVAQLLFPVLARIPADPGIKTVGEISAEVGKFSSLIPEVIQIYAASGVVSSHPMGPVNSTSEAGLVDYGIFAHWERFGDLAKVVPKNAGNTRKSTGASALASKSAQEEEAPYLDPTPKVEIPVTDTSGLPIGVLVDQAETLYNGLNMIDKRICQKVMVILAKLPPDNQGKPSFISVGDMISEIGRFDSQIIGTVDRLRDKGLVSPRYTGPIEFGSEVRLSDLRLADEWSRLNKWLYLAWAGGSGSNKEAAPQEEKTSKPLEPKAESSQSQAKSPTTERKKPKIIIKKKRR